MCAPTSKNCGTQSQRDETELRARWEILRSQVVQAWLMVQVRQT